MYRLWHLALALAISRTHYWKMPVSAATCTVPEARTESPKRRWEGSEKGRTSNGMGTKLFSRKPVWPGWRHWRAQWTAADVKLLTDRIQCMQCGRRGKLFRKASVAWAVVELEPVRVVCARDWESLFINKRASWFYRFGPSAVWLSHQTATTSNHNVIIWSENWWPDNTALPGRRTFAAPVFGARELARHRVV